MEVKDANEESSSTDDKEVEPEADPEAEPEAVPEAEPEQGNLLRGINKKTVRIDTNSCSTIYAILLPSRHLERLE